MFPRLEERRSDSPFVERVWRTASERAGAFTSISTVHWSIVVAKRQGRVSVSLHGPETAATRKEHPPELAWFGIVLALGTYLPAVPPGSLVDAFHRDRTHPSSVRTAQYRFRHATGLSSRTVRQIERARHAAALLRDGVSTPDTVFAAGYADQPHLIRPGDRATACRAPARARARRRPAARACGERASCHRGRHIVCS